MMGARMGACRRPNAGSHAGGDAWGACMDLMQGAMPRACIRAGKDHAGNMQGYAGGLQWKRMVAMQGTWPTAMQGGMQGSVPEPPACFPWDRASKVCKVMDLQL